MVPVEALAAIAGSGASNEVARIVGTALGKRAAARIGQTNGATVEAFATALGGELAVAGYGALSFERWGRALVLVVEHAAVPDPMLGAMLAHAIEAASGRGDVACATLAREGETARLLVASKASAARVNAWLEDGVKWGEALTRLHSGGAA
jgi:hypothetical protein